MVPVLAASVFFLLAVGVHQLLQKSLLRVAVGLALVSHAVHLILLTAGRRGAVAPVLPPTGAAEGVADPLPQAFVLPSQKCGDLPPREGSDLQNFVGGLGIHSFHDFLAYFIIDICSFWLVAHNSPDLIHSRKVARPSRKYDFVWRFCQLGKQLKVAHSDSGVYAHSHFVKTIQQQQ